MLKNVSVMLERVYIASTLTNYCTAHSSTKYDFPNKIQSFHIGYFLCLSLENRTVKQEEGLDKQI